MGAGTYLGTALAGALRAEWSAEEVRALWDATDPDLREVHDGGTLAVWVRSADGTFRLAPLYFTPVMDAT